MPSLKVTRTEIPYPKLPNSKDPPGSAATPAEKRRMTEDFLKRTPDRMENIWRRCKKLTGTLVTLKRLASVQEQRFHPGASIEMSLSPTPSEMSIIRPSSTTNSINGGSNPPIDIIKPQTTPSTGM